MYSKDEILSIQKCNCGRSYCQFFGGGVNNNGTSFSTQKIQEIIDDLESFKKDILEMENYLKELLN